MSDLRAAHIAMWTWLAENPTKGKKDWPGWVKNGGLYEDVTGARCFACEAADDDCDVCPIDWSGHCENQHTPYTSWNALSYDVPMSEECKASRSRLAMQIAEMWPA